MPRQGLIAADHMEADFTDIKVSVDFEASPVRVELSFPGIGTVICIALTHYDEFDAYIRHHIGAHIISKNL